MNNNIIEKPSLDSLLDQNLHDLINCMASRFFTKYGKNNLNNVMITHEDLTQQGFFGAMIAYESFDPNLGYTSNIAQSFRTRAYPYVKNAMLTYCRKFSHTLSISEKAARNDWGDIINIGVIHIDQLDDDEKFDVPIGSGVKISQDVDEYFLAGFTQLERNLVKDHIIDEHSLQKIANKYNISKSRVGEIIRGLTERMKVRAENYVKNDSCNVS